MTERQKLIAVVREKEAWLTLYKWCMGIGYGKGGSRLVLYVGHTLIGMTHWVQTIGNTAHTAAQRWMEGMRNEFLRNCAWLYSNPCLYGLGNGLMDGERREGK